MLLGRPSCRRRPPLLLTATRSLRFSSEFKEWNAYLGMVFFRSDRRGRRRGAHRRNLGGPVNGGTSQLYQQLIFRPAPGFGRAETSAETSISAVPVPRPAVESTACAAATPREPRSPATGPAVGRAGGWTARWSLWPPGERPAEDRRQVFGRLTLPRATQTRWPCRHRTGCAGGHAHRRGEVAHISSDRPVVDRALAGDLVRSPPPGRSDHPVAAVRVDPGRNPARRRVRNRWFLVQPNVICVVDAVRTSHWFDRGAMRHTSSALSRWPWVSSPGCRPSGRRPVWSTGTGCPSRVPTRPGYKCRPPVRRTCRPLHQVIDGLSRGYWRRCWTRRWWRPFVAWTSRTVAHSWIVTTMGWYPLGGCGDCSAGSPRAGSSGGSGSFGFAMLWISASRATPCSSITDVRGCCWSDATAATAHTGHHTCVHLPGAPASAAADATAAPAWTRGSSIAKIVCASRCSSGPLSGCLPIKSSYASGSVLVQWW